MPGSLDEMAEYQVADYEYDALTSNGFVTGVQKSLPDPCISEAYMDALELRMVTRMEELFKEQSKELMEVILSNSNGISLLRGQTLGSNGSSMGELGVVPENRSLQGFNDPPEFDTFCRTGNGYSQDREEPFSPISPRSSDGGFDRQVSGMSRLATVHMASETDQKLTSVMQAGEHSCFQKAINSSQFRIATILVIMVQSAVLGWESHSRLLLEKERLMGKRSDAELANHFSLLEYVFLTVFALEWLARIVAWRWKFFDHTDVEFFAWNIFDTVLVIGSFLSLFQMRVSWLRSVRLFRVARILRIFRLAKKLRKMSYALIRAIDSMFWLIILLSLMLYIFSLVMMKASYTYMQDVSTVQYQEFVSGDFASDAGQDMWTILNRFDSLQSTMLSLFAAFTNGSEWDVLFKPIMDVSPLYALIVIFFIILFVFAVMNVVTGVFVEDAMKIAQTDESLAVSDSMESEVEFESAVERFMSAIDDDKDGLLNGDQFLEALKKTSVKHWLAIRGIELTVEDARRILEIFGDQMYGTFDASVLKDVFQKVRGQARRSDLIIAIDDLRTGQKKLQYTLEAVEKCEKRILDFEGRMLRFFPNDVPKKSVKKQRSIREI